MCWVCVYMYLHTSTLARKHVRMQTHTQAQTDGKKRKKKIYCIRAERYCYYDVIPSGLCLVWPHLVFQQYSEPKHTFRAWKVYLTRRRLIERCARWPCPPFHITQTELRHCGNELDWWVMEKQAQKCLEQLGTPRRSENQFRWLPLWAEWEEAKTVQSKKKNGFLYIIKIG